MGLLDNSTAKQYYQGNDLGNYQFTSLDNIISQFEVAYVGENKIIPKIKRADIQFHAMRAMQELSFDTFKSIKAQQIDVAPSLQMLLPRDYVNYTKLSWVDSAGIKHPLYPTKHTSNPFHTNQNADGTYAFPQEAEEVVNQDFSNGLTDWIASPDVVTFATFAKTEVNSEKVEFSHRSKSNIPGAQTTPTIFSYTQYVYQQLDVSDKEYVTLSADGQAVDFASGTGEGVLRVGLSTSVPDAYLPGYDTSISGGNAGPVGSLNTSTSIFDLSQDDGTGAYIEWTTGNNTSSKSLGMINVSGINTIYVIAVSYHNFSAANSTTTTTNNIDNISVINSLANDQFISNPGNETSSSTWNSYKSISPSENSNDDYEDDTYWPMAGNRYGLEPEHAQVNGSFYIDNIFGKIHFSSNISGKTVILDYISDSLGTDAEMQVHKFAEDAMYKWIAHAILSTSSYGQQLVPRLIKEKFAAVRKAKLRLSNIKLEELTQILRGKSKQIKH